MVLKGQADKSLLDSYFIERVQIAKTNTAWSISNAKRLEKILAALAQIDLRVFEEALKDQTHHINSILLDLGFIYGKEYQTQTIYKPTSNVGARAPHCWLKKKDEQISILDLYKNQFSLVCHPDALYWQNLYLKFPCKIINIGKVGDYLDIYQDFLEKYEISKFDAILVRPDGHVAWHAKDEQKKTANLSWLLM